jgi:hypothetical protein
MIHRAAHELNDAEQSLSSENLERDRTPTEPAIIHSTHDQLLGSLGDGGMRPGRIAIHVDYEHVLGSRAIV